MLQRKPRLQKSLQVTIPNTKVMTKKRRRYSTNIRFKLHYKQNLFQLLSAMIDRMGDKEDDPLPQHTMDGVDSDEWSD